MDGCGLAAWLKYLKFTSKTNGVYKTNYVLSLWYLNALCELDHLAETLVII